MTKILLIEDEKNIQISITYYLQKEGFKINSATNVEEARKKLEKEMYNLKLLDVTLPDGNGFDLYKEVIKNKNIPVIFLTALDEEKDIVKGFELGADDYITKPFHAGELLSRIKNVLRHTKNNNYDEIIKIRNVEVNLNKKQVFKDGKEIELTALEFKILQMLFKNKGMTISRTQILEYIWDENENFVNDNTLTVYIKRIREKIEDDPNSPKIIKTVRGMGYKIEKNK